MDFCYCTSLNDNIAEFQDCLRRADIIGYDTETNSLEPYTGTLRTVQVKMAGRIFVINTEIMPMKDVAYLVSLLDASGKTLVGHNIKFDVKFTRVKTGVLLNHVFDTMVAENVLHQGIMKTPYPSLTDLLLKYKNIYLMKDTRLDFVNVDIITQAMLRYAAEDVEHLKDIYEKQMEDAYQKGLAKVIELEMKLVPTVAEMELNGVTLDEEPWIKLADISEVKSAEAFDYLIDGIIIPQVLERYNKKLKSGGMENLYDLFMALAIPVKTKRFTKVLISIVEPEYIMSTLRESINLGSPKQLLHILRFLGYDLKSTGEKVLKGTPDKLKIITKLLEYRDYAKKGSTYGREFLQFVNPVTKKIHASFNQSVADTGRFSCTEPNLQQVVADDAYRQCFIASPGNKIVAVDYSQQELRVAGALSKEPMFIKAYNEGLDMHRLTASLAYKVDYEAVTHDQRKVGKGLNFASLYGSSERGIAYNFGLPIREAKELLDNFWSGYPVLYAFVKEIQSGARKNFYSTTVFGRKRYYEKIVMYSSSEEKWKHENDINRRSFNHLVQGSGADIVKLAMIYLASENPYPDYIKPIMVIHDEIACEAREDVAEECLEFMKRVMLKAEDIALQGILPSAVDGKISDYWTH